MAIKRKKLWAESALVTLLTLLVLWAFYLMINISFQPLNYIVNTISSINLNDLWFSSINNNNADTNIVLVNIEDLDREGIALLADHIGDAGPQVMGLDLFFSDALITPHDSLLEATLRKHAQILVLSYPYHNENPDQGYWRLPEIETGHAMLNSDDLGNEVVRTFTPFLVTDEGMVPAFAVSLAAYTDYSAVKHLGQRNRDSEIINYLGSQDAFLMLQPAEVMSGEVDHLLHNKTVLLGYLGNPLQIQPCLNDLFFTPVGFDLSVNRRPDMYGIVIHANILSMILHDRYIQTTPQWVTITLTILLLYLHVVLFTWLYLRLQVYFQAISLLVLGVSFTLVLWLVFVLFSRWNLEVTTALLLTSVALAPNILSLYEVLALFITKKLKWKSLFVPDNQS